MLIRIWLSSLMVALCGPAPVIASVGVSPGGQASYSVAITVPPGIAGMAPNLAFAYADGGVNGPLGVGWSVQGISTISRCPSTKPVDGAHRAVFFDVADKLCIDGQRLIQTDASGVPSTAQADDSSGLVGAATREFRTEKDGYSRIRAYGAIDGEVAKGPAHFKVWTKSGQIYHYGLFATDRQALVMAYPDAEPTSATSRVGAVWLVSRISDTLGNFIDFKYEQREVTWGSGTASSGRKGYEWNVKEIHYTGAPAQTPANRVVFEYIDRPDPIAGRLDRAEAYQRAHKNVSVRRLASVTSYVNAASSTPVAVRTHRLDYELSPSTGRSRVSAIRECAGGPGSPRCMPPATFRYTDTGSLSFAPNATFASSPLATLKMLDATEGRYGAFTGDFNGDGRTDIVRWSTSPAENELWFSAGDGAFQKSASFSITADTLFTTDGCHYAIAADFNGDALTDVLRVVSPTCAQLPSKLFISKGDGSFTAVELPASIDFRQIRAELISRSGDCVLPLSSFRRSSASNTSGVQTDPPRPSDEPGAGDAGSNGTLLGMASAQSSGRCTIYSRNVGHNYYVIDADGDGFLDILTTRRPGYTNWNSSWGPLPSKAEECRYYERQTGDCNVTLHRGLGNGTFEQVYSQDAPASMYSDPPNPADRSNPYWRRPNQADINGDGLQDILAVSGAWRSKGDGYFVPGADITEISAICGLPIDFNGDQRMDCLWPDKTAASQGLLLHYGATRSGYLAQFNLKSLGDELFGQDAEGRQTIGVVVEDFDGDGRSDILRWGQTDADNGVYFSRGDGSFIVPRDPMGLGGLGRPLQGVDRQTSFLLGDFLGNGSVQIVHLKHAPSLGVGSGGGGGRPGGGGGLIQLQSIIPSNASSVERSTNQLYARAGSSVPADLLSQVTAPSGLVTTVAGRVPLPNAGSTYITERQVPAVASGDILDVQPPIYVIPSVMQETGAGSVTTHYVYKGLKAQRNGRGLLGFRETRQQSLAPNGDWQTVATRYLQAHPYIGVAALTETYAGDASLSGQRLSRTAYSYCDSTSTQAPTPIVNPGNPPPPCPVTSKVARPYVHQSVEQGWDLSGRPLPRVTTINRYTPMGDPIEIVVETTGTSLGVAQTVRKTTTNLYFPDQTEGDLWILGRLERSRVQSVVPNILDRIPTVPGSASSMGTSKPGGALPPPSRAGGSWFGGGTPGQDE